MANSCIGPHSGPSFGREYGRGARSLKVAEDLQGIPGKPEGEETEQDPPAYQHGVGLRLGLVEGGRAGQVPVECRDQPLKTARQLHVLLISINGKLTFPSHEIEELMDVIETELVHNVVEVLAPIVHGFWLNSTVCDTVWEMVGDKMILEGPSS